MNVAHGVGGGANLEALLLAVPLVGLGVLFFFQKSATPLVSFTMIVAGVALGAAGLTFLSHDDEPQAAVSTSDSYSAAFLALCDARVEAPSSAERAEQIFFDAAHNPLHELAADVGEADRAAAARLLEAKNEVESALEDGSEPDLVESFDRLISATASGLRTLDMQVPECD